MTNSDKVLKALREQINRHKTQTAYANSVDVTPQYISQLQKGKNPVSALSIDKLEQLFPNIAEINFNFGNQNSIAYAKLIKLLDSLSSVEQEKALQILQIIFSK